MKRALLLIIVGVLYFLHQDFWFWRSARPLVFGFIPIGLFYHACYTVAIAAVMGFLVKQAWPGHLEERVDDERGQEGDRPISPSPPRPVASLPVASKSEGTER